MFTFVFIKERKGKEADLYSAYCQYNSTTKRSVWITQSYLQIQSAFPSYKHSLEGDTAANSFTLLAIDISLFLRCIFAV